MIGIAIDTDGLDRLEGEVRGFVAELADLTPLAASVQAVVYVQNLEARRDGLDRDGDPFAPLAESTLKRRHGDGPPLAPMDFASRVMAGFEVEQQRLGPQRIDVVGSWPSMSDFLGYHVTGTRNMPRRDPVGVTPRGWAQVADALDAWLDSLASVGT